MFFRGGYLITMFGRVDHIEIKGIKAVVPKTKKHTLEYADVLGKRRCERQIKLTGVLERRVSLEKQKSSDLALEAVKALIADIGWRSGDIDVLVFATQNPLYVLPSTAFYLQKELGMSNESIVFDINLGCSAAPIGIQIVSSLLLQGKKNAKGLLLISDAVYEIKNISDPNIVAERLLFGSAGSAVALEKNDEVNASMAYLTKSDGRRYEAIICPMGGRFSMDGEAVFAFGINDVCNDLLHFKEIFDIKENDIDFYSFHQAQLMMLDAIDSECGIVEGKELRSLDYYGNTNGSSVLLNLCANSGKFQKSKIHVIMCAFGVGLSWSYMDVILPVSSVFPITESDTYYEK